MLSVPCPTCSTTNHLPVSSAGTDVACVRCTFSFWVPPPELLLRAAEEDVATPDISFFCRHCRTRMFGPRGERTWCGKCNGVNVVPDAYEASPPPWCGKHNGLNVAPDGYEAPPRPAPEPVTVPPVSAPRGRFGWDADDLIAVFKVVIGVVVVIGTLWVILTPSTKPAKSPYDSHPDAPMVDRMIESEARRQGAKMSEEERKKARDAVIIFHEIQEERRSKGR